MKAKRTKRTMKVKKALIYNREDLNESAVEFLRCGWCVDENDEQFWLAKSQLLDTVCDHFYNDKDWYDKYISEDLDVDNLDFIPNGVWKTLNLPNKTKEEIEQLGEEDPTFEVYFKLYWV